MRRFTAFAFVLLIQWSVLVPATVAMEPMHAQGPKGSTLAAPEGFETVALLIANGAFDPNTPHPSIPGCFQVVCDGDYYQEVILGRTPLEIAEQETAAKAFYLQRFGLDTDDPANAGRLFFGKFMFDPRINYRLYALSGTRVPTSGWQVWDGGWNVLVLDPDGFDLGGEHAGIHVPAGSIFVYGDYKIDVTGPNGQPAEPILLHYQAEAPMIPDVYGGTVIRCQMIHPAWGEGGVGQGMFQPALLPDGRVQFQLRNTLSFPGPGN
jgi:hypothetical protein